MKLNIGPTGALSRRFVLLAPRSADTAGFRDVSVHEHHHRSLMEQAQRLRANVYLEINAVDASGLTPDGRHVQSVDDRAWHLLTLEGDGEVSACARYVLHENNVAYSRLSVRRSALAQSEAWGPRLRAAVEEELSSAKARKLAYAEVGGWAISRAHRCSTEAIRMMLTFYALSEWFGGVLGICTAKRLCSAPILRRVGGRPMTANGVELPPYFDPEYNCELEVLKFDSSQPNPKYEACIQDSCASLATIPVVAPPPHVRPSPLTLPTAGLLGAASLPA